ncbi:helix-turn-helix transcriptional regulator [Pseudobutyrivibrio sp.]|uniref:helix-turn-helix transcriptional regulator n=1 Tax=Pseudobutyrivibrio sp. TaxID=2014367 RepID=UPI001D93C26F|nr:helix-turn-helix transcriptional regulator [Pseudobutyrivibrio sp.]MBE5912095.1 helix-turn-helix transcriptional regulator [Pseudobutyrivibrio sp.]
MKKNVFGYQVAYFRKAYNLSQEELAEMLNCATSTISRIENGVEYPRKALFDKMVNAFENFGIAYEELPLEESFELQRAKDELLAAIHDGSEDKLQPAIEQFEVVMECDNIEHQQYYMLAKLLCMKYYGLSTREFVTRCIELFEIRRSFPKTEDIPLLHLSKIEHMIIFKYAMSHYELGENDVASEHLEGLMRNCFSHNTEFQRRRCKSLSMNFAKVMIGNREYHRAQKCVNYTLRSISENFDTKMLLHILDVQKELFGHHGNQEGEEIIDEFIKSSIRMMDYIYIYMKESA